MKPVLNVVCGLAWTDQKIFAARRSKDQHLAGHWEFPGGKVHNEENPAAALVREWKEELDIDITVGETWETVEWESEQYLIRLLPFSVSFLSEKAPSPKEHDLLAWIPVGKTQNLSWAPADIPILETWRKSLNHTQPNT